MNMNNWVERMIYGEKKPFPLLSYPAAQFLYVTVKELACDSGYQALGIRLLADRYDMPAALTYMDLSVEAEAFGAHAVYAADEVPTIIGKLVSSRGDAEALPVPEVGAGRTGECVKTVRKALSLIGDRPVIANCIGPFSLAGRLLNVNDIMVDCYMEPETVHIMLKKASEFITKYIMALKDAGADGVVLAEPLAGLLSPELMSEFSSEYVRQIVGETQDSHFIVIYHNCGGAVNKLTDEIAATGCKAFHFGEPADMPLMLEKLPKDRLVLGNISPSGAFNSGTKRDMRLVTTRLLESCKGHRNFVASSGCDVPPYADLDNIDTFFETVKSFYYRESLWDMIS